MRRETLVLDGRDNVAAALTDLQAAETVHMRVPGGHTLEILLRQAICLGHKFALRDITRGSQVIKGGFPIGTATEDIAPGEHVHTHNLR